MRLRSVRRLVSVTVIGLMASFIASCGDSGDRDRNVEVIAGQMCQTLGLTRSVSKIVNVCGRSGADLVWYAAVSKKPSGSKCSRPGGFRTAGPKTLICGVVNNKRMWIEVAPLPVVSTTTMSSSGGSVNASDSPSESSVPSSANTSETTTSVVAQPTTTLATVREEKPSRQVDPAEAVKVARVNSPATRAVVTTKPTSSANGSVVSPTPVIQMVDDSGEPRPRAGVAVRIASATIGVVVSGGTGLTNSDGSISFPDLKIDGPAGQVDLAVLADGFGGATLTIDHTTGPAVGVRIVEKAESVKAGEVWHDSPHLQLIDVDGFEVATAGEVIDAEVIVGKGSVRNLASVTTDDKGSAKFDRISLTSVGKWTIVLTPRNEKITAASFDVEVFPASAASLVLVSDVPDRVVNGTTFTPTPRIQIVDRYLNPVAKAGVRIAATTESFSTGKPLQVTGGIATTDSTGLATFDGFALTGAAGQSVVEFNPADSDSKIEGGARLVTRVAPSAPVRLVLMIEPWTARSGVALVQNPQLYLADQSGNKVTLEGESLSVVADQGVQITNDTTTFDADGIAAFKKLTLTGTAGAVTLSFVYGNLVTTYGMTLQAGPFDRTRIKEHPLTVTAGAKFGSVIELLDAQGNIISNPDYVIFAVDDEQTKLAAVYSGSNGTAVFSDMTLSKAGKRTVSYVTINDASSFAVTRLEVTVVPADGNSVEFLYTTTMVPTNDRAFGADPEISAYRMIRVRVRDAFGNVVPSGQPVDASFAATPGSGATLSGTRAATDESGIATFSNLKIVGPIGKYKLNFAAKGGGAEQYPGAITLIAGAPVDFRIERSAAGFVNRKSAVVQPIIQLIDSGGNPSPTSGVNVTATVGGANVSTLKVTRTSDAQGLVTFSGIGASGRVSEFTITYEFLTSGNKQVLQTETSTLSPGAPASLMATIQAYARVSSGMAVGTIDVLDVDSNDVPVSDDIVTISVAKTVSSGAQSAVWLSGTLPWPDGRGSIDATDYRVYGTQGATGTLSISIPNVPTLKVSIEVTSDPAVGDPGPSGGSIVSLLASRVSAVTGVTSGGRILEVAPPNWDVGTDVYPINILDSTNSPYTLMGAVTSAAVGTGAANTKAIVDKQTNRPSVYGPISVANGTFVGFSDWFLPSSGEFKLIDDNLVKKGKWGTWRSGLTVWYMTSSLVNSTTAVYYQPQFGQSVPGFVNKSVMTGGFLTPVRVFG